MLTRCDAWNSLISGSECKSYSEFINAKLALIRSLREELDSEEPDSVDSSLPDHLTTFENAYGTTVISKREFALLERYSINYLSLMFENYRKNIFFLKKLR